MKFGLSLAMVALVVWRGGQLKVSRRISTGVPVPIIDDVVVEVAPVVAARERAVLSTFQPWST